MPAKRNDLDLSLQDRIARVLEKHVRRRDTARRTALNLVEMEFWAREIQAHLLQLSRIRSDDVDAVGEICGMISAKLGEVTDHGRDARRALERMIWAMVRPEMEQDKRSASPK